MAQSAMQAIEGSPLLLSLSTSPSNHCRCRCCRRFRCRRRCHLKMASRILQHAPGRAVWVVGLAGVAGSVVLNRVYTKV